MDRTSIGFALNGLHQDLGVDAAQQGLAAGIFFIGYLVLQIPGGYLAEHWSAKKFVGIMVLIRGVLAILPVSSRTSPNCSWCASFSAGARPGSGRRSLS